LFRVLLHNCLVLPAKLHRLAGFQADFLAIDRISSLAQSHSNVDETGREDNSVPEYQS
jgi:hypothetical protein